MFQLITSIIFCAAIETIGHKKTLLQLLATRFQGGRWDSNGEAVEPIPLKIERRA